MQTPITIEAVRSGNNEQEKSILFIIIALVLGIVIGVGVTLGLESTKNTGSVAAGTGEGLASWATRAYSENWSYVWGGASAGSVDSAGLISSYAGCTHNTEAMFAASEKTGEISTLPEIPGLGLYMPGHVGIYIGDGMCVDAATESTGVRMAAVSSMNWTHWFEVPGIDYTD